LPRIDSRFIPSKELVPMKPKRLRAH